MYKIKSILLILFLFVVNPQQVFAFSFEEGFDSSFGKVFGSSFEEKEEDCPKDVKWAAAFAWNGQTINQTQEMLYNKYKKQVFSDTETLKTFKQQLSEALKDLNGNVATDLLKDWEYTYPIKGASFSGKCGGITVYCKNGELLKDCNADYWRCYAQNYLSFKLPQDYNDFMIQKICKNTGKTEVQNTVTTQSSISTGDPSAYTGYDPAEESKQLHGTPEPVVNKQEPDEAETTITKSANQSNIETGDNPAREICVEAKGRWDKDRDWCECPKGFQWNEDESEEKSIGCYQEDMPSNDKKEVNIDSNSQTSGTSSTRQDTKKRSSKKSTSAVTNATQTSALSEEVCTNGGATLQHGTCVCKKNTKEWDDKTKKCITTSKDKKICEEQEKGKWITQGNTSTCTCPNQSQGYFWNKDRKQCEYEDTDATPEAVCTNGGATLTKKRCVCNNKTEEWDDKTKKCITKEKKIIAGTPCKLENATTAMYKKDENNQLVCKVVTCNPNYKKNATETVCEAQQKETKEKCKELPANATAGIVEKTGSAKGCKVTACSSGYKVSDNGKSCVEQSEEEKAQEKTNLENEYEADMEELHKAFLDKIEQLKQINNK